MLFHGRQTLASEWGWRGGTWWYGGFTHRHPDGNDGDNKRCVQVLR